VSAIWTWHRIGQKVSRETLAGAY